jgi:hypothetical protein
VIALRLAVTVLAAVQAGITAYLGFGEQIPQELKIAAVVASAVLAVLINQLPRIQDTPVSERPKPTPRG